MNAQLPYLDITLHIINSIAPGRLFLLNTSFLGAQRKEREAFLDSLNT